MEKRPVEGRFFIRTESKMFGVTVRQRIVFGTEPFPRGRFVQQAEARALRSLTLPFAPFIGLELTGENGFYCQIKSIRWCLDTNEFECWCGDNPVETDGPDGCRDFQYFVDQEIEAGWSVGNVIYSHD